MLRAIHIVPELFLNAKIGNGQIIELHDKLYLPL